MEINPILCEEVSFRDYEFFKDSQGHIYDVECFDGYGIGTNIDDEDDAPRTIKVIYPTLEEVLSNEKDTEYVLRYRGLYDLTPANINYDDIMMAYGKIKR